MSEDNKLRVVMVEPGKPAYETEIENTLKAEQEAVGGYIEVLPLDNKKLLICNEEGKLNGMRGNRRIGNDVIAGPFFIVGEDGDEFRSLTDEEVKESLERFAWIRAIVQLFTLFGWGLFAAGMVVAIFDLAVEYQSGRANIKNTLLNILKGFFACSLIGLVPIELYKFCISLQNTFAGELARIFSWQSGIDFSSRATIVLGNTFAPLKAAGNLLLNVCLLIAFAYCVIKVFFQNIKRGGILLVQMSVGSLYMFSVPRGYTDGFVQWMKQVAALCLTAFMQTTLLFAGLMTFSVNMLLGLGIMLAASEVPRIAQQFGLDSSTKFNMMNVVHATTTAINLSRAIARSGK